jgi:membrane protein implicated in regulation of membrane protease activity
LQPSDQTPDFARSEESHDHHLTRTLVWIGVAGLGAALAFTVWRAIASAQRAPDDPTSQRIQQLIDEANTLLKTLDEQRNSA